MILLRHLLNENSEFKRPDIHHTSQRRGAARAGWSWGYFPSADTAHSGVDQSHRRSAHSELTRWALCVERGSRRRSPIRDVFSGSSLARLCLRHRPDPRRSFAISVVTFLPSPSHIGVARRTPRHANQTKPELTKGENIENEFVSHRRNAGDALPVGRIGDRDDSRTQYIRDHQYKQCERQCSVSVRTGGCGNALPVVCKDVANRRYGWRGWKRRGRAVL